MMNSLAVALEVEELKPADEGDADRFVLASPSGTFFHLSGWRRIVEKTLGHKSFCLIARRGETMTGVFPFSRVRNLLFGDCLISMPLAVYGGICAEDSESFSVLLKAGGELARRLDVKYLEMRDQAELFPTDLPRKDLYVSFVQDLSPGPDKLLAGLPRDTRYMVRKSLKAGLEWTEDLTMDEFYGLYSRSVHRLGTPVFSKQLFFNLQNEFGKQCRMFAVRKDKLAIAGVFCFYFRDRVLPYYAGSLPEFNKDSPNNFMYWNLMVQSCAEGLRTFDFGRSKKDTGAFQFKSSWAMKMVELPYHYQLHRAKSIPQITPVDPKFHGPVSLWKRLPYPITTVIGPRLIPWIPSV